MPNTPSLEKTIEVVASPYGTTGNVQAVKHERYFELVVNLHFNSPVFKSMSHDEARALRDALIELYPVTSATLVEPPRAPYFAEAEHAVSGPWVVKRAYTQPVFDWVAECDDQATAEKIAAALNAQETTNAAP